jgi:predicted acetyltransferase
VIPYEPPPPPPPPPPVDPPLLSEVPELPFEEKLASITPGYAPEMIFSEYLKFLDSSEKGLNLPNGFVPSTSLCAFLGDQIVGRVSLRHQLNDYLLQLGGHIGYGVLPNNKKFKYIL